MNNWQAVSLGQGQFQRVFPFTAIRFRLVALSTRVRIMCVGRGGGPLAKAIIGARRSHNLEGANREKEEKQNKFRGTYHGYRISQKSASPYHDEYHIRNCLGYPFRLAESHREALKRSHDVCAFYTGGIPSRWPYCCVLSLVKILQPGRDVTRKTI